MRAWVVAHSAHPAARGEWRVCAPDYVPAGGADPLECVVHAFGIFSVQDGWHILTLRRPVWAAAGGGVDFEIVGYAVQEGDLQAGFLLPGLLGWFGVGGGTADGVAAVFQPATGIDGRFGRHCWYSLGWGASGGVSIVITVRWGSRDVVVADVGCDCGLSTGGGNGRYGGFKPASLRLELAVA